MGLKPSDKYAVPLCHAHHHDLHTSDMSEELWWALNGVDPYDHMTTHEEEGAEENEQ